MRSVDIMQCLGTGAVGWDAGHSVVCRVVYGRKSDDFLSSFPSSASS